jgi:hypothetical protein
MRDVCTIRREVYCQSSPSVLLTRSILIFEAPIYPLLLLDQTSEFVKERALSIISGSLENQRSPSRS